MTITGTVVHAQNAEASSGPTMREYVYGLPTALSGCVGFQSDQHVYIGFKSL